MGILTLPDELLLLIGQDLYRLWSLFEPCLHELGVQNIGELTALQWAAERGKATLAKLAISRGADVSEPNQLLFGRTPLNSAALCGDPAVIEILVEHGAKVNARYYQTPLHLAVVSGNVEAIKVLLNLGSDALAIDTLGDTPAHSSYVSLGSLKGPHRRWL